MVIFDWDGTLCDSVGHIVEAMQGAAHELGAEMPPVAAVRDVVGLGLPQAVATLFPQLVQHEQERVAQAYSRHYTAGDEQPPKLFEGALETLEAPRGRGLLLAVATGKSRRGLRRILSSLGLADYFDATRCADETRSKPDPLMLQQLMAESGRPAEAVVMVGDTEYDLAMARNAGVASVGVSFGVHSRQRLAAFDPVAVVDSLPELLELELFSRP